MLIQVALPVPLYRVFDYLIPSEIGLPAIGSRVSVPFGRQKLIGIVIAHIEHSELAFHQLKPIHASLDDEPILDSSMLALANWLANYYHYPLGNVMAVMLPTLIRQGNVLPTLQQTFWQPVRAVTPEDFSATAKKQRQQFALFELQFYHTQPQPPFAVSEQQLLENGVEKSFLQKFADKNLLTSFTTILPLPAPMRLATDPHRLNPEQQSAVAAIVQSVAKNQYQGFLLNGITGSGKTEVYLQAMQSVLEQGKQVLILVPEIGLTPQTRQRFAERFHAEVLMLHSGLNDTIRLHGWQACRTGHAQIIIGTRSAVLYSFANLGLIIVDESHDLSYKQQDTLRYHATDVALYRGFVANIPVVLGTATPSLESLYLVKQNKLTELRLTQRAGDATQAKIQLIDARQQAWQEGLTQALINEIHKDLAKNQQVLVFLNRRGYAPILLCDACGWQADCPRCDAHLTVHFSPLSLLKCHHCDWQAMIPKTCPHCSSPNLDPIGMGTARMVEGLGKLFPDTPIIQIDRDTTRRKDSWEKVYQQIADNPSAILVGTQMVAKGHHFPNVTLVAMPNADRGFLSADFRSPEHTAQLMIQVAGRAGRAEKPGRVLIQTLQPENPSLLTLVRYGYSTFAEQMLDERKMLGLPPFTYACLVRAQSRSLEQNHAALNHAKALLPSRAQLTRQGLAVHGAIDAPMAKKNSRFHSHLLILGKNRGALHGLLDEWWQTVIALPETKYVKLSVDIDPSGWA